MVATQGADEDDASLQEGETPSDWHLSAGAVHRLVHQYAHRACW